MIYFGPDLMQRMIGRFHDCLVPGAWLLVGPSEPNMTYFSSFRTVNAPGVTLYQKPSTPAYGAEAFAPASFPVSRTLHEPDAPLTDRAPSEGIATTLADVRRHADLGEWDSAARLCERLLKKDNLNST